MTRVVWAFSHRLLVLVLLPVRLKPSYIPCCLLLVAWCGDVAVLRWWCWRFCVLVSIIKTYKNFKKKLTEPKWRQMCRLGLLSLSPTSHTSPSLYGDVSVSCCGVVLGLDRGLYTPPPSPPETPGIQRTQILECRGVTRAKSAYLFREESRGVHRKPAYSSGVHGIRPDFFRWGNPPDTSGIQWNYQTPAESSGKQWHIWTPAESGGLHWNIGSPVD